MVSVIRDCLAAGMTEAEVLADYPTLDVDGIRASVAYGAELARDEHPPSPPVEGTLDEVPLMFGQTSASNGWRPDTSHPSHACRQFARRPQASRQTKRSP